MPLAQPLDPRADAAEICTTAQRWKIEPQLALGVYIMARLLPFRIAIISGYRTRAEQEVLIASPDTTAAPVGLSNHTACPARAVDLRPILQVIDDDVKLALGRAAAKAGLRWGGGAPRDPKGIPERNEWRHVDLGPRPR